MCIRDSFNTDKHKLFRGMRLAMKEERRKNEIGQVVEIDILNRINHPNVVSAFDTFEHLDIQGNCKSVNLVLPLANYSLTNLLDKVNLNPKEKLELMHQLLCGLFYLHSNFIIHEDIKPDNILIFQVDPILTTRTYKPPSSKYVAKITDFGLSNIFIPGKFAGGPSQTLLWRPPEIIGYEYEASRPGHRGPKYAPHRFETDIWAMGMVLYEIITGFPPFKFPRITGPVTPKYKLGMLHIIHRFLTDDSWKENPVFTGILKDAPDLISKMLDGDEDTRINVLEALN